ncbi:MAG: 16S rRNA (guanine(527)-N(7))-methyltransferase RsmG [Gammaproteobacteria bacterium]|nr:16S rRNA (guanine(527)-N(7))-methyltransferase RsmG [Gammaproteobacteria bacterium]MBQ0839266.1 16S rRNA (guanine(527)-N(7))-methyltransferase RsmG [Gammaproteobacteria bacterium]
MPSPSREVSLAQLDSALQEGIAAQGLQVEDQARAAMLQYIGLLQRWNKAYNLTSIKDPLQMLSYHLLDSLSIGPYLQGRSFIDVGTGAGLPGIPLAITHQDKTFSLLDSNGKKVRFLFQIKTALKLGNVKEWQGRVEQYKPEQPYDGVISRAFASLTDMIEGSEHLLTPGGCFYAMKGRYPDKELSELPKGYKVEQAIELDVPTLDQQRHLIIIKKS